MAIGNLKMYFFRVRKQVLEIWGFDIIQEHISKYTWAQCMMATAFQKFQLVC